MDKIKTTKRVLNYYTASLNNEASKFEVLISCFKVFEAVTKYRMINRFGGSLNSFGKNFTHLKEQSKLDGESDSFYVENENFIYAFKNARNTNSHDSDEVQNIDLNLIRKKTYELLLDFSQKDLKLKTPSNLIGYVETKPQKLVQWLSENSEHKSTSKSQRTNKKSVKSKVNNIYVDKTKRSDVNENDEVHFLLRLLINQKNWGRWLIIGGIGIFLLSIIFYFQIRPTKNKNDNLESGVSELDTAENDFSNSAERNNHRQPIQGNSIDMGSGDNTGNIIVGGDMKVNNHTIDSTSKQ